MRLEVVYLSADAQHQREVRSKAPLTAAEALERSGLADKPPGGADPLWMGVFGRKVAPDAVLNDGDRLEIYEPLAHSPEQWRRLRAEAAKRGTRSGG